MISLQKTDQVQAARAEAIEAINVYCANGGCAWSMAKSVADKNGWAWATDIISGMEYAALILMLDILANGKKSS